MTTTALALFLAFNLLASMKFIDHEVQCLAFDIIVKLTGAQKKRNGILMQYGKSVPRKEQEELDHLNKEISSLIEKLIELYNFY